MGNWKHRYEWSTEIIRDNQPFPEYRWQMHHKDFVKYAFCHCNMRDNCRQVEFYNFLMKVLMILKSSLYFSFNTFFAMRTSLFVEAKIPIQPLPPIIRHTMTIITVILLKFLIILYLTPHISSDNVLTLFVVSVCWPSSSLQFSTPISVPIMQKSELIMIPMAIIQFAVFLFKVNYV